MSNRDSSTEFTEFTVHITPNDRGIPAGKIADAELRFIAGPLAGLKLIGFSIWRRGGGGQGITFPALTYNVNGEKRSVALLRPIADPTALDAVRAAILDAYARYKGEASGVGSAAGARA